MACRESFCPLLGARPLLHGGGEGVEASGVGGRREAVAAVIADIRAAAGIYDREDLGILT